MDQALPVRRSIRLSGFDYSSNHLYFVTICTQDRACILGKVVENRAFMSPYGRILEKELLNLTMYFPLVVLDKYVVMPNHLHVIIGIRATVKITPTLGHIIGAYKSRVFHNCLELAKIKDKFIGKFWQRNYYEHIIRDQKDLERIQKYIRSNPMSWTKDKFYS